MYAYIFIYFIGSIHVLHGCKYTCVYIYVYIEAYIKKMYL